MLAISKQTSGGGPLTQALRTVANLYLSAQEKKQHRRDQNNA